MNTSRFTPEQFSKHSGTSQIEIELKKWLRSISVAERVDFIRLLWPINYILALELVLTSQLPVKETEALLRNWLIEGKHNTAERLINCFQTLLGEKRFWKIVSEEDLSPAMREFINYHSHGRLHG